jgi:hypothetical protein
MRNINKHIILILLFIQLSYCQYFPLFTDSKADDSIALIMLLMGGAGSSSKSTVDLSPGASIDLTGTGQNQGILIDTNNDGVSDGIDLTGDGIPNILLLDTNGDGIPDAIDLNGNGNPNYYINPNPPPALTTGSNGSGESVILIIGAGGVVLGFDTDGDGVPNDTTIATILQDSIKPTLSFSPLAGTFSTNTQVTLRCQDNLAPGYIIYTINGGTPSFPSTGNVISSPSGSISLTSDGSFVIRAICRDLAGNDSILYAETYIIDSNIPNITITNQSTSNISNSGGISSATIDWTVNREGTYTLRDNATNCETGTVIEGPTAVPAGHNGQIIRSASQIPTEGVRNFQICVTSTSNLVGSNGFTIRRDDTNPNVAASPTGGSFGISTSISLNCSDSGSGCYRIAYTVAVGSTPADPVFNAEGIITTGSQYSTPISTSDGAVTTIKYRARDNAGNISNVIQQSYTVDTILPNITVNSSSGFINGSSSADFNWQANRGGTYQVRLGGDNCSNGSLATGTNVSGTLIANTPITTIVNNANFSTGSNTIRLCAFNLIDSAGSTTRTVVKDTVSPTAAISSPATGGPHPQGTTFTATCSDTGSSGCDKIAYTVNGSDPSFDTNGNITLGTLYTSPVSMPNGSSVNVRVRAIDNARNLSNLVNTNFSVGPPDSPVLHIPKEADGALEIFWSSVSGATSYRLYRSTSPGVTTSSTLACDTASTSCNVTGLTNNTIYYFRITALHSGGVSNLSNEVNGRPNGLPLGVCNIQWPETQCLTPGQDNTVNRIYGLFTTNNSGGHSDIIVEIGYGPTETNPITHPNQWTFQTASYNIDGTMHLPKHEYMHHFVIHETGSYKYVYRFREVGHYKTTYCGWHLTFANPHTNFPQSSMGTLEVKASCP